MSDPQDAPTVLEHLMQALTVKLHPAGNEQPRGEGPRLGRYRITGHLGAGGMGEVLQVRDEDVGREMAAKVILGDEMGSALSKFVQEAQITGQLEHPNIIPLHELGMTPDGRLYFTMKRVEGQTLAELLAAEHDAEGEIVASRDSARLLAGDLAAVRRTHLTTMLNLFLKVCDAIAFAHSRGVIHRDLKPANIMVGQFGEVQVMDWGLARVWGQVDSLVDACTLDVGGGRLADLVAESGGPLKTVDGSVVGTPAYMPPEQARGEVDQLDRRADIYSLGAILYEMLTLEPPYDGESVWNVLHQVLEGQLVPPAQRTPEREIPWETAVVVSKAMATDVDQRYETVAELKADLDAYLAGKVLAAADYSIWQVWSKWARRNKAAVVAAVGIVLSVIAAFSGISWQLEVASREKHTAESERNKAIAARDGERLQKEAAVDARRAEAAEKNKVQERERSLRAKVIDFESMSDVKLVEQLADEWADLGPQSWKLQRIDDWLVAARGMRDRVRKHATIIERLRKKTSRTRAEDWQLGVVTQLLPRIREFVKKIDDVAAMPDKARQQLAGMHKHQAKWATAIAAIRRSPSYQQLDLSMQEGLLPLAEDPQSGLWEFAHLPSGKPPVRGGNGRWKITEQTSVVLVLLPGGQFRMGATAGDRDGQPDERPAHEVTLAPFFLSKYELTQGQWQRLTGKKPSRFVRGKRYGAFLMTGAHPVESVSWHDCRSQLARVGLLLPTEAQWEYAARAGSRTIWWTGNDSASMAVAGNVTDQVFSRFMRSATRPEKWNDGHAMHASVGAFQPNRFGLHDVIGNVYEWCRDPYLSAAYSLSPSTADGWRDYPDPANRGTPRVNRGGGWDYPAINARSASRSRIAPAVRNEDLGCRPSRPIIKR
ncbi:SUMF1/EgtB/PvdO family nonheme iron enzyme [Acidimicrobium ferrooxidans]|nr:SUMF1/EgtB/PvdO family nonheme iron enzyme [Acidimicrobium ferrooxidans]